MKPIRKFNRAAAKLGFTLIELSIVLVIIGLIVGGILVGQDLIKAAEIRATVSQLEKYSTAVNTFRSKYNGVPGDLLNASNFGFDSTRGINNGNSIVETVLNDAGSFAGETSCFWDDLTFAGMINESLNQSAADACGSAQSSSATNLLTQMLPPAKLGRSNYIHVGSAGGVNYFAITGVTAIAAGMMTMDDLLTGSEAFQIDSKIDDGGPTAGSVQATVLQGLQADNSATLASRSIFTVTDAATVAASGVCVAVGGIYNFATNAGNDQGCQLRIRASF